jgi:hypothetical protein
MADRQTGKNWRLVYDAADAVLSNPVVIGDFGGEVTLLRDCSAIAKTVENIDVTGTGDTTQVNEPGIIAGGGVGVEAYFVAANRSALEASVGEKLTWGFFNSVGDVWYGIGWLSKVGDMMKYRGEATYQLTIQPETKFVFQKFVPS